MINGRHPVGGSQRFLHQSSLHQNLKIHNDIHAHRCVKCNQCYRTGHALKCHMESMHTDCKSLNTAGGDARLTDKVVRGQPVTRDGLTGIFTCRECPQQFSTAGGLTIHRVKSHRNVRGLTRHRVKTSGPEHRVQPEGLSPKCQGCNMTFMSEHDLRNHKQLYLCPFCQKCLQSGNLCEHIKAYHNTDEAEELKYELSITRNGCRQTFSDSSEVMSDQELSMCPVCKQCFDHSDLPTHLDEQHNKDISQVGKGTFKKFNYSQKRKFVSKGGRGINAQCITFCQAQASLIHFYILMQIIFLKCFNGTF